MSGVNQRLDLRDLAAASFYSCGTPHPRGFDLIERSPIPIQRCLVTGKILPSANDNIHIARIEIYAKADALCDLGGHHGGSGTKERIEDQFTALRVIQYRTPHQLEWLLRRVIEFFFLRATHDEFRGRHSPHSGILAGLSEPRCVLFPDVPAGLMLKPIVGSREYCSTL